MSIQSLSCALPFCSRSQEEQTQSSCILRTSALALGAIALLAGILILSGVPGLQALGTTTGWLLTTTGSLILLAGLCLRCIEAEHQRIVDPMSLGSHSSWQQTIDPTTRQVTTERETYCSLSSFLTSDKGCDVALRSRLTAKLRTEDLTNRLIENFGVGYVELALPLIYKNEIRNDVYLLQILKLIYMPNSAIFALSLGEIKGYDEEKRNILCLRLSKTQPVDSQTYEEGTLGAFLSQGEKFLSDTLSTSLYLFFTYEQVVCFINNASTIDDRIVKALLPDQRHFISTRTVNLLSNLPIKCVNKVLPSFTGQQILSLMHSRASELDFSLLSQKQVEEMFPPGFMVRDASRKRIGQLDIGVLNKILPKMIGAQLCLLPDKHLKDKKLFLSPLSKDQVSGMFPSDFMEKDASRKRLGQLDIGVLNQILLKMSQAQLQLVPDNQLRKGELDLHLLDGAGIKGMFPMTFMEKDKSSARIKKLSQANQAYVRG